MLILGQYRFVKYTNHGVRGTVIFIVAILAIALLADSYQELLAIYTLSSLVGESLRRIKGDLPCGPSKSSL